MNKIVVYRYDDWECLYVNGVDKYQNHSIKIRDIADFCPIESIEVRWVKSNYLNDFIMSSRVFPTTLQECEDMENK